MHRAGFRTVAACEIDDWRRAVFAANNPGARMFADIRDLRAEHVADLAIDIVVGSPPCQDASAANTKGKGLDGERTGLFWEWLRLVRDLRPLWACAENSPRMRTLGVDRILDALGREGYTARCVVVGAADIGAPHIRKRMWLIAADAERIGLREQSGRRGGQDRQGEAESPDDAVDTNKIGPDRRAGTRINDAGRSELAHDACDAAGEQVGRERFARQNDRDREDACDADSAGLAIGQSIGSDARPELAAIERAIGARGLEWNGGPSGSLRMVDGLPAGLARACISAYGDSVVPQITEAIGRTIMRLSRG